jgi:lactonase
MRHPAIRSVLAAALCTIGLIAGEPSGAGEARNGLAYDAQTRGPVPIPPAERSLQTVTAEPWFKVSDEALPLEGPSFERDGNLVFAEAGGGRIFRLTPDSRSTGTGASSPPASATCGAAPSSPCARTARTCGR